MCDSFGCIAIGIAPVHVNLIFLHWPIMRSALISCCFIYGNAHWIRPQSCKPCKNCNVNNKVFHGITPVCRVPISLGGNAEWGIRSPGSRLVLSVDLLSQVQT